MNPLQNPIFVTYHRLSRKAGLWGGFAAVILGGGFSIYLQQQRLRFTGGGGVEGFYFWWLFIQALALGLVWMMKTSNAINLEKKDGMFETNWLTPLSPSQSATGYYLGPPVGSFYTYAASLPVSFILAINADLSFGFWLGTQAALVATAAMAGMVGLLGSIVTGMVSFGVILLGIWAVVFSAVYGSLSLASFILPIHFFVGLLEGAEQMGPVGDSSQWHWDDSPRVFTLAIPGWLFTIAIIGGAYRWLWVAAKRKLAVPLQPALHGWQQTLLFTMLVLLQHGMVWHVTRGHGESPELKPEGVLAFVHAGTLLLGMVMVIARSWTFFELQVEYQYGRPLTMETVWRFSGLWLAVRLAAIGYYGMSLHFYLALGSDPWPLLLSGLNLLFVIGMMAMILEIATYWFDRVVMVLIMLMAVFVMPLFLFYLDMKGWWWVFSPLATGIVALVPEDRVPLRMLQWATFAHGWVFVGFVALWVKTWTLWLESRRVEDDTRAVLEKATSQPEK